MKSSIIIVCLILMASFANAELLIRDDFQDRKSWWRWERIGGGVNPSVHDGVIDLRVNYGRSSGPSDSAIWNGSNIYGNCTIRIRAKTVTSMQPGTLGWGLWNYNGNWISFDMDTSNIAWFMKQYDPFNPSRTWWAEGTRDGSTGNMNFGSLDNIDTSEWHNYKIERYDNAVRFYVDGILINQYTDNIPQGLLAFHLWIDNYNYSFDLSEPFDYRTFDQPNALISDFVEIYNDQPGSSESPAGSVLLKEMPNETGSGEREYLWKEYTFESPSGRILVLITARVENYGDFSNDDDIRVVIDNTDLGWDTETSFDGELLNAKNDSLIYESYLDSGQHTISIYGDITPILYDVTVIGTEHGDIILNEELNEQAPGGNEYLWKEYSFNCINDEEVTIYISASAHENTIDDDSIRIVLNDEDFGWNTDYSINGNRLFGEAKALIIRRNMSAGEHTLRLYADETPILHNVIIYGSEELSPVDLLWRNIVSGQNVFWLMEGTSLDSYAWLPSVGDTEWDIIEVADFNQDNDPDILWRHATTGQNVIWVMDGTSVESYAWLDTVADTNWRIVGLADFDQDGDPDILWRHSISGQNVIWVMNGTSVDSYAWLETVGDTSWEIAEIADFDTDNDPDILWRHATSGQNVIWVMDGTTRSSYAWLDTFADTDWEIKEVADFDTDGDSDILARHATTGQNIIWMMDGTAQDSYAWLDRVSDTNWEIIDARDYDGDGDPDILWRHATTGQNVIWVMDGTVLDSYAWLDTVADINWEIK